MAMAIVRATARDAQESRPARSKPKHCYIAVMVYVMVHVANVRWSACHLSQTKQVSTRFFVLPIFFQNLRNNSSPSLVDYLSADQTAPSDFLQTFSFQQRPIYKSYKPAVLYS